MKNPMPQSLRSLRQPPTPAIMPIRTNAAIRSMLALLSLIIIFLTAAGPAHGAPFLPNERLKFKIRWGVVPAGEATLEVLPLTQINNNAAQHFVLTVSTYPAIDIFYKLRQRIDSYTDPDISRSFLYKKLQRGRSERDVIVTFDWQTGTASYTNFGVTEEPVELLEGTLDPLSALYFLRCRDLAVIDRQERPVTDGKKVALGNVKIVGRETITVNNTTYDTYKLEPDMKDVRGVFKKSKNAKLYIWVTADERRMLVKLESEVSLGSFVAELIEHNYPMGS